MYKCAWVCVAFVYCEHAGTRSVYESGRKQESVGGGKRGAVTWAQVQVSAGWGHALSGSPPPPF